MTAMLTTMIPCSAKLPIIALVMGVLAGGSDMWWVAPMFYLMGIVAIIISAVMLKKTKRFAGEPTPFVMELPDYHMPAIKSWALHVWERVSAYVKKAGTIIFAAAVGIWALSNFGLAGWEGGDGSFGFLQAMDGAPETYMDYSILAGVGGALSFIFAPLGFGNWQATASTISALIAKENLVSPPLASVPRLGDATENSVSMWRASPACSPSALARSTLCHVRLRRLQHALRAVLRRRQAPSAARCGDPKWFWFALATGAVAGSLASSSTSSTKYILGTLGSGPWSPLPCSPLMLFQLFRPMPKWDEKDEHILDNLAEEPVALVTFGQPFHQTVGRPSFCYLCSAPQPYEDALACGAHMVRMVLK